MKKVKKGESEKLSLSVEPRTVFGKRLRTFKYHGLLAGNIYGADFKSRAVTVELKNFVPVFKIAQETGVIYINLEGDEIPVLVRDIQRDPLDGRIIHIDFRKINLKQKIETAVPIELVGESVAVNQKGGVLLKQTDELVVEALPQDIPAHIAIDLSTLQEVGDEIKVSDLAPVSSYVIKEEPEKVIVSVTMHKEESVEVQKEAVATEITAEKPEGSETDETPSAAETAEKQTE